MDVGTAKIIDCRERYFANVCGTRLLKYIRLAAKRFHIMWIDGDVFTAYSCIDFRQGDVIRGIIARHQHAAVLGPFLLFCWDGRIAFQSFWTEEHFDTGTEGQLQDIFRRLRFCFRRDLQIV